MKKTILHLVFILLPIGLFAHGALHERIERISKQLELEPSNDSLYFERGLLYFLHEDYARALIDYKKAETFGYNNNELNYCLSELYSKKGIHNEALIYINIFLQQESDNPKGYRLRACINKNLSRYSKAIKDSEKVINSKVKPHTIDYTNLADIIMVQDSSNYKLALAYLKQGCERLGDSFVLKLKALEINKGVGESYRALEIYDNLLNMFNRKEVLLYEKANYLFYIKEYEESNITLKRSKELYNQLAKRQKYTKMMLNLRNNIQSLQEDLDKNFANTN